MFASNRFSLGFGIIAGLLFGAVAAQASSKALKSSVTGNVGARSIDVIDFGPGGLLLIGDGRGSQIIAVETEDTSTTSTLSFRIENVGAKLAGRLGTTASGIVILDMAVNPASGRAYFAIRKQDDKSHVILTIDGKGNVDELLLENVVHARVELSVGGKSILSKISDIAWADDRILASARTDAEFASKLFVIPVPLSDGSEANVHSVETYHISHGRWETKAPMSAIIPFREGDKSSIVGAFTCTPVVKYPLDALRPGAKVKGISVLELGSGNRPLDMFTYEKNGDFYVLANTWRAHHKRRPFGPSPYWTVRFERNILSENVKVNEQALRRLGKDYQPSTERVKMIEEYHGVKMMDKLDENRALVLRTGEGDKLDLEVLGLP